MIESGPPSSTTVPRSLRRGCTPEGQSAGQPTQPRVGYALRFPDDQPFRGSHGSVMIDRSEGVGFGQREVLHNIVMTLAGSPSGSSTTWSISRHPGRGFKPAELQLDRFSASCSMPSSMRAARACGTSTNSCTTPCPPRTAPPRGQAPCRPGGGNAHHCAGVGQGRLPAGLPRQEQRAAG